MSTKPGLWNAVRALHLEMLAEIVDEHRSRGNFRTHLLATAAGYGALVAMASLARITLQGGISLDAGTLLALAMFAFFLPLDALAAALSAAVAAPALWAAGALAGHGLAARLGIPFAVFELSNFVLLGAHAVFDEPFTARRPKSAGYRAFRVAYNQLFGLVHYVLIELLALGYRPRFRRTVQAAAKDHGLRNRHAWENWAGLARCEPAACFYPESVEDLSLIVREAAAAGRKVRVVGAGHSFSALCPTDDYLVFTARMTGARVDVSDPERPRVTVEAGTTNRAMNDELERHGLALPFNVVLESVRVVALVCTGSHGSGWNNPTLSDLVESLEVVTASGELRVFSRERDGAEVMAAACLNLGLFGIVARVTLRAVRSFRVRQVDRKAPMAETIRSLATLVPAHEYLDLFWWPFNDSVWVKTLDRTEAARTDAPRKRRFEAISTRVLVGIATRLARLCAARPALTPWFCRTSFEHAPMGDKVVDVVEGVHYRRAIEAAHCRCLEFAFPVDPEFARVEQAWSAVVAIVERHAREGRYPFNLTMNARFVRDSEALLSPARGNGRTCYIEVLSYRGAPGWDEFAREVAAEWAKLPGARPHWAKELAPIPGGAAWLRGAFGEGLARFVRVRRDLGVDPGGMFANALLEDVLAGADAAHEAPARAAS